MLKEMYYWMIYFSKKIRTTKLATINEFNAYLIICMLLMFNILTIIVILCFIFKFEFKSIIQDYKIAGIIFGLSIMIPNYFLIFTKRQEIYTKYDQLPKVRRIIGMICFWIYSIVSIPLFFKLVEKLIR